MVCIISGWVYLTVKFSIYILIFSRLKKNNFLVDSITIVFGYMLFLFSPLICFILLNNGSKPTEATRFQFYCSEYNVIENEIENRFFCLIIWIKKSPLAPEQRQKPCSIDKQRMNPLLLYTIFVTQNTNSLQSPESYLVIKSNNTDLGANPTSILRRCSKLWISLPLPVHSRLG